jgi:O-antigen/teichoic acid export membrane protein
MGLNSLSCYLVTIANAFICMRYFGLAGNARYGLSLQLFMIAASVASVWTAVKWPIAQQLRARGDLVGLRRTLWPRVWLQTVFYLAMSLIVIVGAPYFLKVFAPAKSVLPMPWLALLGLVVFFDMQFSFWTGVIATENRMPFLWPLVISSVCAVALTLLLTNTTELGLASLVLAPLITGLCFNYWRWPIVAARTLSTTLLQYLFSRPRSPQESSASQIVPG